MRLFNAFSTPLSLNLRFPLYFVLFYPRQSGRIRMRQLLHFINVRQTRIPLGWEKTIHLKKLHVQLDIPIYVRFLFFMIHTNALPHFYFQ